MVDAPDASLPDHVVERLERDVGVDRAGAIAQQQGEVMDLARVAAFDHQPGARAAGPRRTMSWCSPEHASSEGIGAISAVTPRSERTIRLAPCSIAAQASSKSDSQRRSMPRGPLGRREEHRQSDRL